VTAWLDGGAAAQQATPLVKALLTALSEREEWSSYDLPSGSSHAPAQASLASETAVDRERLAAVLIAVAADRRAAAAFAPVVLELACGAADVEALVLLQPHLEQLSWQIEQVVRRAAAATLQFDLVFSGGVAAHWPALRQMIVKQCAERGLPPGRTLMAQPLQAALRLARLHNTP
jgi:hypothetical protein